MLLEKSWIQGLAKSRFPSIYLMAVIDRCDDLSEDSPRVFLRQFAAFVDVIIQLPLCATIQHQNYPLFVLKNWKIAGCF